MLWYLEIFYNVIVVVIECEIGQMVLFMMKMSYEGFGCVVFIVGCLIVVNCYLCDVYCFGYVSLVKLVEVGSKFVKEGVGMVEIYKEVVNYG